MSNLQSRTITGAILVATMVVAIILGKYSFFIFFGALVVFGLFEFFKIFETTTNIRPQKISGILLGLLIFISCFLIAEGRVKPMFLLLLIPSALYILIREMFRKYDNPLENIAITLFGVLYIAIPVSLLWLIAYRENLYLYNYHLILAFFILIWVYDSFAYLIGMAIGKRRLFERISPKKSWEGAFGGLAVSVGASILLSTYFTELSMLQWALFAILVAVFGTFGDLFESMLKRSVNIKDSGTLLPGHGGILDRFDALFLAVPVLYLYLQFV